MESQKQEIYNFIKHTHEKKVGKIDPDHVLYIDVLNHFNHKYNRLIVTTIIKELEQSGLIRTGDTIQHRFIKIV